MFSKWVMTIAVLGILMALLEALLPEGGMRKAACMVIGLVMLVSIAAPIVELAASPGFVQGVTAWAQK